MKKASKIIYILVILILVGVFLYSGGSLLKYYWDSNENQNTYDELANMAQQARPSRPSPAVSDSEAPSKVTDPTQPTQTPWISVTDPNTGKTAQMLPEFEQLYLLNNDLVGWITIEGTVIDYPVVQSGLDNVDFYLYRDFYKRQRTHGCIYVREQCDVFTPSDNVVMYGHRMKDGSMFDQLSRYLKKDFWQAHSYIYFDTLRERHTYQIAYVLTTTATVGKGFTYHSLLDEPDDADWDTFVAQCEKLALYDTGVDIGPGDKLITLSTCEYTHVNGRLVVIAKRID